MLVWFKSIDTSSLVDKDRKPNWKPKNIQDVDETRVNLFFEDLGNLDLILKN